MNKNKYLRLTSGRTGEFAWTKTADGTIIVRDKDDGEIMLTIQHAIDQKTLIADSYNAGLLTGLSIHERYVDFLESLTAPLMPNYEQPEYTQEDQAYENSHEHLFISDAKDNDSSKYYAYEIFAPPKFTENVEVICKKFATEYNETFYTNAASIWMEDITCDTNLEVYASPNSGEICRIFMNKDQRQKYIWLSEQKSFDIKDLLYTAIKTMANKMLPLVDGKHNIVAIDTKQTKEKTVTIAKPKRKMTKVSGGSV